MTRSLLEAAYHMGTTDCISQHLSDCFSKRRRDAELLSQALELELKFLRTIKRTFIQETGGMTYQIVDVRCRRG